ncbi:META domain-containing protein [Xanthobacter autotrophicus]|uniref:META domain-containing protein n=1 Tax=Xanthobacter TaxID=279 RepID=UPI0024AA9FA3|nr:META domain-containing protein [Xanthobacter autotrophicus]MDI4664330.1 META domain-containing protein [Xanthobacter autotrophicus]
MALRTSARLTRRRMMSVGLMLAALWTMPAGAQDKPLTPVGEWLAEDIGGGGVLDRVQSTLVLGADGAVSGTGGCNRYSGKAKLAGASLRFGALSASRMACTPAVIAQEQKFLLALERTQGWRIDPLRRKLILLDLTGTELVTFSTR